MHFSFIQPQFFIKFISPVLADTPPLFVLRSMLGKNLRAMCCISKKSTCPECQFNRTCAYAFLFETILPTDNSALPGRNRASHPFSFAEVSAEYQNENHQNLLYKYAFKMTLFGKAIDYLPYIYAAFARSGQNGLFKSRTQFEIESVEAGGKNILLDENHLDLNFPREEWKCEFGNNRHFEFISESEKEEMLKQVQHDGLQVQHDGLQVQGDGSQVRDDDSDEQQMPLPDSEYLSSSDSEHLSLQGLTRQSSEILVNLESPLRFKVQGKYTTQFSAEDFIACLFRRAKTLCVLYGEISDEERNLKSIPNGNISITERSLRWKDLRHYSARQKSAMELGGVVGTFKMKGNFSGAELSLLNLAEIAGAGKNTNFGLGQVEMWRK